MEEAFFQNVHFLHRKANRGNPDANLTVNKKGMKEPGREAIYY